MSTTSIQDTIMSNTETTELKMSKEVSNSTKEEEVANENIKSLLTSTQRYFILMLAVCGGFYSSLRRAYNVSYDEALGEVFEQN
ncbi:unnamed protein product [Hanseniaspora opuntiae]